jgi:MFS family permease
VTFSSGVNSALQLAVAPAMRGRVMAVYSMVFLGTTPIGAPVVGWIAEVLSPRAGLAIGAVAALLAAAVATMLFRRAGTWAARPEPEMVRVRRRRRTVGRLGARVAAAAPQRAGSGAPS